MVLDHSLEDHDRPREDLTLSFVEGVEAPSEIGGALTTALLEEPAGRRGDVDDRRAPISRVWAPMDEPFVEETSDDPGCRRLRDALPLGEVAHAHGSVAVEGEENGGLGRGKFPQRLLAEFPRQSADRAPEPLGAGDSS